LRTAFIEFRAIFNARLGVARKLAVDEMEPQPHDYVQRAAVMSRCGMRNIA
jgi:hypothetical protein